MSSKAILASPFAETSVTLNTIDQFLAGGNSMYFMAGRGSFVLIDGLLPGKQWTNDAEPPMPEDTPAAREELWTELLYGREIPQNNINLVMPSIQGGVDILTPWADRVAGAPGTLNSLNFVPYDDTTPFTFGYTQNRFYVKQVGIDYQVFMCMEINGSRTTPGDASGGEPDLTVTTVDNTYFKDGTSTIVTKGTDVWKYLYTLHTELDLIPIAGTVEDNFWVPINYGSRVNTGGGTTPIDDVPNLPYIIGARNITIQISLPADFDEIEYRQNWIVMNPTGVTGVETQKAATDFPNNDGDILYIEHRPPQIKQANQQENILIAFNY